MTEDWDKRRQYVHGVANPRIARTAKEQNYYYYYYHTPRNAKNNAR